MKIIILYIMPNKIGIFIIQRNLRLSNTSVDFKTSFAFKMIMLDYINYTFKNILLIYYH